MTHCKSLNPHWKQDTQMCTDGTVGRDTCNADSGGPLMGQYNDAGDWGLVGVTSYGEEGKASSGGNMCGTEGGAGFYTYAAYYADWIAQNAGLERDKILVVNSTTVHPNATLMAEASEGSTVLAVASESLTSAAAAGPASGIAAVVAAAVHIAMCLALA
ncbi:hypothetical protein EC988_009959 [Linderina pennispora]|nr:hypothetical protein EC988_009959 [Linderina pennispora]